MDLRYELKRENYYLLANFYGTFDLNNSIELVMEIVNECKKTDLHKLFIDVMDVNMAAPSQDYYILGRFAKILEENKIKVAVCIRNEQRHPDRIAENVARSYGVHLNIGENRDELLAWLLELFNC